MFLYYEQYNTVNISG